MIFVIPSSCEQATGSLGEFVYSSFPVGVSSLASILLREGVPVKIVNEEFAPLRPERIRELAAGEPETPVFGMTCLTMQAQRTKELGRLIKQAVPEAITLVGGIHATCRPEEFLTEGIDYVFRGEGELFILELARKLSSGADARGIPGLAWMEEGQMRSNPMSPERFDLADLPAFPLELFEDDLDKYDLGIVVTSRGCPFECIFCSQRAMTQRSYRTRPMDQVMEELDLVIHRFGVKMVFFIDDNLVVDKQRTLELCRAIRQRGFDKQARFMCQMRGDAAGEDVLDAMYEAGFRSLSFGLETGSERVAEIIKKGETVASNRRGVELAHRKGFQTLGTFILGFPGETHEERLETIRFGLSLPLDVMRVNIAIPYPGTPLFEMVKDRIHIQPGWTNFNVVSPLVSGPFAAEPLPYVPQGASTAELRYLMLSANLRFWLRPRQILRFFTVPSTGVTTMPKGWYRRPYIWWRIFRLGTKVLGLCAWVAALKMRVMLGRKAPAN